MTDTYVEDTRSNFVPLLTGLALGLAVGVAVGLLLGVAVARGLE